MAEEANYIVGFHHWYHFEMRKLEPLICIDMSNLDKTSKPGNTPAFFGWHPSLKTSWSAPLPASDDPTFRMPCMTPGGASPGSIPAQWQLQRETIPALRRSVHFQEKRQKTIGSWWIWRLELSQCSADSAHAMWSPMWEVYKKNYTIDAFLHEGSMPCFATPRPNQHAANLTDVLVRTRSGLLTGSSGISSITDMLGSSLSQASIRCAPIMKNIYVCFPCIRTIVSFWSEFCAWEQSQQGRHKERAAYP